MDVLAFSQNINNLVSAAAYETTINGESRVLSSFLRLDIIKKTEHVSGRTFNQYWSCVPSCAAVDDTEGQMC